jgi:hypothetical protein
MEAWAPSELVGTFFDPSGAERTRTMSRMPFQNLQPHIPKRTPSLVLSSRLEIDIGVELQGGVMSNVTEDGSI